MLGQPRIRVTQDRAARCSTYLFDPGLDADSARHASVCISSVCAWWCTYLSCARVAKPVSTGAGVPDGSWEFSRGAMLMRYLALDPGRLQTALGGLMSR